MNSIEEIKARLDIADIVGEHVQLRRTGKNYTGFCPFHANSRTPAFVVFPETGTWRCFGQCNEGGDIFKYVMKREGWDFGEALRHLADRAGVELKPLTPQEEAKQEEYQRLRQLLEEAVTFYRHHLIKNPAGKTALDYLHGRGLSDETIETFELGYAPPGWDNALKHFLEKGYTEEEMLGAGLVSERDSGGHYDRFRHRVIFPIRDGRGKMAGFGARAIAPDDMPKYLNSPQTALFDKSYLLYGLDKARRTIRAEDQVVIVEGYLDVIAPYQAGFTNLVSPMGTALTEHQLNLLKRYTRRIVMALDADAAGAKATLRGLQIARQTLDRETDFRFDARGLLRQEGRLQADIRVTTLPEGLDPDEVVNENPDAWPALLDAAKPIVVHVMETLAASRDLDDPKQKTEIAKQVMPLIQDIPNAIERDTYVQQLARLLKVDEGALLAQFQTRASPGRPRRRRTRMEPPAPEAPPTEAEKQAPMLVSPIHKLEDVCISLLIRNPDLMYRADRALQEAGLERLSDKDFQLIDHQEMFRLARESLDQDYLEPLNFTLDNLPLPMIDFADEILLKTKDLDPYEERVLEELIRNILDLRRRNLVSYNNQLRYMLEDAQEQGDLMPAEHMQRSIAITQAIQKLDKALARNGFSPTN